MLFERFIDKDLGHISYIIACEETSNAAIIDPRRDTKQYDDFILNNNLLLKYILNSHTHADYIGGHLELSTKYNAINIFHKNTPIINYDFFKTNENDILKIGTIKIRILETPGHTPFDLSFIVNENKIDKFIFSGDLLMIGDIGRPDLLGNENLYTLAVLSYQSAKKIYNLSDDIIVFSSHIKGSLCGKNLGQQYFSTIGIEKKGNYSFKLSQDLKEKFIKNITSQKIERPNFFTKMASINIEGPKLIKTILKNIKIINLNTLTITDKIQIIDIREPKLFYNKHIKNSINIYENSNVSLIAGSILDYNQDIYIIGDKNSNIDDFIIKLLRVGLDNIKGIINDDINLITNHTTLLNTIADSNIDSTFTNILIDNGCSTLGNPIQSSINDILELDLLKYQKIIISCNYGFKSSSIASFLIRKSNYNNTNKANIFGVVT